MISWNSYWNVQLDVHPNRKEGDWDDEYSLAYHIIMLSRFTLYDGIHTIVSIWVESTFFGELSVTQMIIYKYYNIGDCFKQLSVIIRREGNIKQILHNYKVHVEQSGYIWVYLTSIYSFNEVIVISLKTGHPQSWSKCVRCCGKLIYNIHDMAVRFELSCIDFTSMGGYYDIGKIVSIQAMCLVSYAGHWLVVARERWL